ncbi:MAG: DEAD/DEAH box helicase [Chloroflexi bacterium]|uniref:DEAD/DEAH box helicase n=1 Tax=Candidatus Chlorohelix allophototropha TaxID=3003348 RepID=A0A8T7M3W2_9CHLR|nr:DEAD/DEAH box helicase [Chloroflexota bacterium]WJW69985.1 DEAD/DEAH box helicase [Chloroflexota bacterium L227-S17]
MSAYSVGSLVRCREREWVVLPSESDNLLLLRPLGGSEKEQIGIYLPITEALGIDKIEPATFPEPDINLTGDHTSGRLLRDATRLTFRSGAGPFRSLGRISVRPRPFQLVPLLMALRLDPVRLLIADDVGIGKTIEAGLIARELLDRGDAKRLAVLCPPHLCEQWQRELSEKFALEAVVVRSGTLAQLERTLPPGDISVYEHYPVLVVSIDFVKSDRQRDSFIRSCPELVIVDEAHTATRSSGTGGTQQRHELMRELAKNPERHLLLLTATPHSGVEDAFLSLLEQLDETFGQMDLTHLTEPERKALARHFVQRRRADVERWLGEDTPFPQRKSREVTYSLAKSPEYRKLFEDIYDFARELVKDTGGGMSGWKQRVRYWAALALLRCVMSSPAAAEATLKARLGRLPEQGLEGQTAADTDTLFAQYVLDLSEQEVTQDFEPTTVVEEGAPLMGSSEKQKLQAFVRRAKGLYGDSDPKAAVAAQEVAALIRGGYQPIVYCRYIATAEYLAGELKRRFGRQWSDLQVIAVTGASSEEEREQRVAELAESPRRVLVATDCLSEGINLQESFNAVVHYDLPWNPNRLEQREGRVDRYGQPSLEVRTVLLFGDDNPIDQAVLKVLLRKAVTIHKSLGITVPLPVDSESVVETVVRSLFKEDSRPKQLTLFDTDSQLSFEDAEGFSVDELHQSWDKAVEREKESRTRFAQHSIKPEEVAQELYETDLVLGNAATVATFVQSACERLNAPLVQVKQGTTLKNTLWRLPFSQLPLPVREKIGASFAPKRGAATPAEVLLTFDIPVSEGVHLIGRLHPLTEALAEYLLDTALEGATPPLPASRCGVIRTANVTRRTNLLLLRMRLLIESPGKTPMLAEELVVAGFEGRPGNLSWLNEETARKLLDEAIPAGNLAASEISERLSETLSWIRELKTELEAKAEKKAGALYESHRRVRQATRTGRVTVRPQLPLDVLGLYVYLPVPKGVMKDEG